MLKGNPDKINRIKKAYHNDTLRSVGEQDLRNFLTLNGGMDIMPIVGDLTLPELVDQVYGILDVQEKEKITMGSTTSTNTTNETSSELIFERGGKTYHYAPGQGVEHDKFLEKKELADKGALRGRLPSEFKSLIVSDSTANPSPTSASTPTPKAKEYIPFTIAYGDHEITITSKAMLGKVLSALEDAGVEPDEYSNPNVAESPDPLDGLKDTSDPLGHLKDEDNSKTEITGVMRFKSHIANIGGLAAAESAALLRIGKEHGVIVDAYDDRELGKGQAFDKVKESQLTLLERIILSSTSGSPYYSYTTPNALILEALEEGTLSVPVKVVIKKSNAGKPYARLVMPRIEYGK